MSPPWLCENCGKPLPHLTCYPPDKPKKEEPRG